MNKSILFSLISAAVFSMSAAQAGGGSLFGGSGESDMMNGIYVGGSVGQSTARCQLPSSLSGVSIDDKTGQITADSATYEDCDMDGWKVFGGYKFTENLAAELGYYNIAKEKETYHDDALGEMTSTGESSGIGLTGVYSYEIMDNLEVFGKAGLMRWEAEGTQTSTLQASLGEAPRTRKESGTSFLYGVGASYKLTDNIGVRGEWERYTAEYPMAADQNADSEETDVDVLSAGVTFSTY